MNPIIGFWNSILSLIVPFLLLARIRFLSIGSASRTFSLSVIIPARNEENRIRPLLRSLKKQTFRPDEVWVVDDQSTDRTAQVVEEEGFQVISNEPLPQGWAGKTWACWNGAQHAKGDLFLFLDADIQLQDDALERLIHEYASKQGVITLQPYHEMERAYERFSAFFNMIVVLSMRSFSIFGNRLKPLGAFGPVLLSSREDYFRVGGHEKVKACVLEDVELGLNFIREGIPVHLFAGKGSVSFRMYPEGIKSLMEGWSKNFASGASKADPVSMIAIILIIAGMISAIVGVIRLPFSSFGWTHIYFPLAYAGIAIELRWIWSKLGRFGWWSAIFFPVHLLFFIGLFFYSMILTRAKKEVTWKGRKISTAQEKKESGEGV